MLRKAPSKSAVERAPEQVVRGRALELPLVERVSLIRSQSASRIGWHAHRRFELLFVLDGATSYELADGRILDVPGGHFLIVPPGVRHRGLHDVRRPVRLCGVQFDPSVPDAGRNSPFSAADLRWIATMATSGGLRANAMSAELRRTALALAEQIATRTESKAKAATSPGSQAALRLVACTALLEAAQHLAAPRLLEPTETVRIATSFMEDRLDEPLEMTDVARAAGCSRARLFAVFKQSTGLTPNDFLQRLRVTKAQQALSGSTDSITLIALSHGFSTSQYFSNVFRKYTGATPSEFRAKARRTDSAN